MSKLTMARLPDVAEIIMGQSPPGDTYNEAVDGLPFFQGKAEFGEVSPTPKKWCNAPKKIAEAGDILMSVRAPVGPTNLASTQCCIGRGLAAIRANPELLDPSYLRFALRHAEPRLASMGQGSTFAAIGRAELAKVEFPLPPLAEQRRIVDILSRAEGIVRLRRDAEKKAAELIPALFLDMFGDPATNPKGWRQSTLDESGAAIRYGIGQPLPQIEGGLPFLRATNVKRGVISRTGLVYIDPNTNPMKRNPPLKHTDILVVRSGAYTGDIAQVGREFDGAIAGYDLVLSPGSEHLSEFLATYLLLPHVQNGYMAAHKIRAAQPHLNSTQLGNIVVPIPPLNIQSKFVENVNSVRSIQAQQAAATVTAQATFDALLSQVFCAPSSANLTSNI